MKKTFLALIAIIILNYSAYSVTPEPTVESSGSIVTTTVYGYPLNQYFECEGDNDEVCVVLQRHYPSPNPGDYGNWPGESEINFFKPNVGVTQVNSTTPGIGYIDAILNNPYNLTLVGPWNGPNFRTDSNTQTFVNYGLWFNAISNLTN